MELSFWEIKNWFTNVDFTVVGSGIVGIHCALNLRERFPKSKILILEKGILPQGASTKNAGFACFGSLSEIIDDLKTHTEQEVINLVSKRKLGLELLRKRVGDSILNLKSYGGYELFLKNDEVTYLDCLSKMPFINDVMQTVFKSTMFEKKDDKFGFNGIQKYSIYNPHEMQIDTGNMMQELIKQTTNNNILILNQLKVISFNDGLENVEVSLANFNFKTKKLLFATNGFAEKLTNKQVKPARAQVLITEPIINLKIKGTFHIDKGYFYFRNIDNRILLGGGRNLDFEGETTTEFGQTEKIQNRLEELLKEVILPNAKVEISHRWSGIMGMGDSKNPIVKQLSTNVYCGVRLGGMGVAIGSLVGQELASLI